MLPTLSSIQFPSDQFTSTEVTRGSVRCGEGIHRTGYLAGPVCVKAASGWGSDANRLEVEAWEWLKDTEDGPLFAEVLGYADDFSWVVMPKCETLAWDRPSDVPADQRDKTQPYGGWIVHEDYLTWLSSPLGRRARELTSDLHAFNVMRHPDGRIVVTDYGMGVGDGERNEDDWGDDSMPNLSCGCCATCGCDC
jgi:hypothetical protein